MISSAVQPAAVMRAPPSACVPPGRAARLRMAAACARVSPARGRNAPSSKPSTTPEAVSARTPAAQSGEISDESGKDSAEPSGAERPKAAAVTRHMSSRVAGASGDASAGSQPFSSAWESWTPAQCALSAPVGAERHAGGHGHGLRHGDALLGAERAVLKALYHAGGGHLHHRLIVPRARGHVRERRGGILRGGGQGEGENCGQGSGKLFHPLRSFMARSMSRLASRSEAAARLS